MCPFYTGFVSPHLGNRPSKEKQLWAETHSNFVKSMASNRELSPDADIEGVFEGLDRSESPVSRPVSPFRGISPVNFSMEGCETQDIIQVHRARLECMMRMSNHSKLPVDLRLTYEQRGLPALENRARAVRWITEVRAFFTRLFRRSTIVREATLTNFPPCTVQLLLLFTRQIFIDKRWQMCPG